MRSLLAVAFVVLVANTALAQADLTVLDITTTPSSPTSSDQLQFVVDIKNNGNVSAGAFVLRLEANGSLVTSWNLTSLGAGNSTYRVIQNVGPWAQGQYILNATVDYNNSIAESNEGNNSRNEILNVGAGGSPPGVVSLSSPSNGATNQPTSITLYWNTPTGTAPFTHQCQVATDSNFSSLVYNQSGLNSTQTTVNGLANSTTYYWRVRASNAYGTGSYSSYRYFTTEAAAAFPEAEVRRNGNAIISGGNDNLGGNFTLNSPSAIVWTINNLGTANLNLTGNPRVGIINPSGCSVNVYGQPATPITPNWFDNIGINITPTAANFSFTVSIANNDTNENPYTFTALGTAGGGGGGGDVYEPDNTSGTATNLGSASTTSYEHSIMPAGDDDWYTFTLTQTSDVTISTNGSLGDTQLWVYNSVLTEIGYDDDSGNGLFSQVSLTALPAGTYYALVREYFDDGEIEDYELSITITPVPDEEFPLPPLAISRFYAHGDTGMIVLEYKLSGPTGYEVPAGYPKFKIRYNGEDLWNDDSPVVPPVCNHKHVPWVVDDKSYAVVWNSRATRQTDTTGVISFEIDLGNGLKQSIPPYIIWLYNSDNSIKNRRSIWLTDSDQGKSHAVALTNERILNNTNGYQTAFLDFCQNPTTNTWGHSVTFTTVYFTLSYWDTSIAWYRYIDLTDEDNAQKMQAFINAAHSRGIRVFAAADQGVAWATDGSIDEFASDIRAFNQRPGAHFDGVMINVEFGGVYPLETSYPILLAHYQQLKYGSIDSPLSGIGVEMRIGAQQGWENKYAGNNYTYLSDFFLRWVDSVYCMAYNPVDAAAFLELIDELNAGLDHWASIQLGMETQHQDNMSADERWRTYQGYDDDPLGRSGKSILEANVDSIYELIPATKRDAFEGYGIYFYQSYLDLEDGTRPESENEPKPECNIVASSNSPLGFVLLILLLIALRLRQSRFYRQQHSV